MIEYNLDTYNYSTDGQNKLNKSKSTMIEQ